MDPAMIGELSKAVTAQFALLNTIFTGTFHIIDTAIIGPSNLKQQEYLNRLRNALKFTDAYAGLYDEQLKTQRIIMYGMIGLIGLVLLAAILKR